MTQMTEGQHGHTESKLRVDLSIGETSARNSIGKPKISCVSEEAGGRRKEEGVWNAFKTRTHTPESGGKKYTSIG